MNRLNKSFRPKEAAAFLGVGSATFWRFAKRPDFPQLIRLSKRCTIVDADAVVDWRDAQASGKKTEAAAG